VALSLAVFVWLVSSVLLVFGMPSVLWTLALPSLTCQRRSGPQKRPLTLNNLLSFAQFEREVIGERRSRGPTRRSPAFVTGRSA
jgi:hypothetical protein